MKTIKLALFFIPTVLSVIAYTVQAQSAVFSAPVLLDTIHPIDDPAAPALLALAAMYTPMENAVDWAALVCRGMTAGGCTYFRKEMSALLWESQSSNIGSTSELITTVGIMDDDTQVWRTEVTIFTVDGNINSTVFALVRRDPRGRWQLDRILSGPGLPLP